MKRYIYFLVGILILIAIILGFITPKYLQYMKLKSYYNQEEYELLDFANALENYNQIYFRYPESFEDNDFQLRLRHSNAYKYHRNLKIHFKQDSLKRAIYVYSIGPDNRNDELKKIINYNSSDSIAPISIGFFKYLFIKGDILLGGVPMQDPCSYAYSYQLYPLFFDSSGTLIQNLDIQDTYIKIIGDYVESAYMNNFNIRDSTTEFRGILYIEGSFEQESFTIETLCVPEYQMDYSAIIDFLKNAIAKDSSLMELSSFKYPIRLFE